MKKISRSTNQPNLKANAAKNRFRIAGTLAAAILTTIASQITAQTVSTVQSSARPQGLDTAGPVNVAATDRDSYQF